MHEKIRQIQIRIVADEPQVVARVADQVSSIYPGALISEVLPDRSRPNYFRCYVNCALVDGGSK